jgi:hypothetical protein
MRRLALACALALGVAFPVLAPARAASVPARIEQVQKELDSLTEDVEDLQESVREFELFDECMYLIGVTEYGARNDGPGYVYGPDQKKRPALAFDLRGLGRATYEFLAFPAEEPPSIECNEDAGQEDTDD